MRNPIRTSQDEMVTRRQIVERLVSRHMRHWAIDHHDVRVTWGAPAWNVPFVSTSGPAGSMRTVPFSDEGYPTREGLESIAVICFEAVRRILRQNALIRAGYDDTHAPAWATAADPLLISCLQKYGIDLTAPLRDDQDLLRRIRLSGLDVDNAGVRDGVVRVGALGSQDNTWSISDYDTLRVHIHVPVPDTMVFGSDKRRLRLEQIVLLPFPVPDRLARRIRHENDGGISIELGRRLSSWAPIPKGIDRRWLRVPLSRVLDIPF
ncbi:hypothetical protein [Sphingomonas sp. 3-13AW]|uniref:hypothetical protein n=1 Tax=Sphingomonas sp. 3-13AW TaxID=3050450 RepID=UPI003BB74522